MKIRKAENKDILRLSTMLRQVQQLHADGRPDIFIAGTNKYSDQKIGEIISCEHTPVFVAVDDNDTAIGYAFCEIEDFHGTPNLKGRKVFYIDDLCVDENYRGNGIGTELYNFVLSVAKNMNCFHLTLNVWHLNQSAVKFYEKLGLKPLKTTMEQKL
ncbi:MAG: GNAT family N-acetyltransferase [Clostridia bacterium]|nr:GNAT family N-acetyltransferase [Clostridia bacterium]